MCDVKGHEPAQSRAAAAAAPAARLLGEAPVPVWGMTGSELLRRGLSRAGVTDVAPWRPDEPRSGALLLLRADHAYDRTLLAGLARRPQTLLCRADGLPVAGHVAAAQADGVAAALGRGAAAEDPAFTGLAACDAQALAGGYDPALRRRRAPVLMPLSPATRRQVEWEMFGGAYKGVTDVVTKHVWPLPAFHVVRLCAALRITPNQVTLVSLVLVLLVLWLFARGQFVPGLVAAWLMTFLDTVDGKLARVTLTASRAGHVLDHAIDLIHPPFWWLAWIVGLDRAGMALDHPVWVGAVVFGGYVLQRLEEGLFLALHRMEIHVWRRGDSLFRLWIARRNPNLLLLSLGVLAGRPDLGMLAVAAWTALGCIEQAVVLVQAGLAARGGALRSWLDP